MALDPLKITAYFHCRECIKELPKGTSPSEYQNVQAGLTEQGFQVWCKRHNVSVCHFKLPIAFEVCRQMIEAYAKVERRPGLSDLDEVHRLALTALGRDHTD